MNSLTAYKTFNTKFMIHETITAFQDWLKMLNVKHLGISCNSCIITQFVYTKKNTEKDNSQNLNKPLTWSLLRSSNWQEANNNPFNSPLSRTTWVNQYQQKTLIYWHLLFQLLYNIFSWSKQQKVTPFLWQPFPAGWRKVGRSLLHGFAAIGCTASTGRNIRPSCWDECIL